jgi:hypothetical protein
MNAIQPRDLRACACGSTTIIPEAAIFAPRDVEAFQDARH